MTVCQVCTNDGDDRRTLRIGCFYDLSEVSDKFKKVSAQIENVDIPQTLFCLTICKDCRADFMGVLGQWISSGLTAMVDREVEELNPERNIPVRIGGTVAMLTEEEYWFYRQNGILPGRDL